MNAPPVSASDFVNLVRTYVEPVVTHVGFSWNTHHRTSDDDREQAVLFEASLDTFREHYERFIPDYGSEEPPCIDLWIKRLPTGEGVDATLEATNVGAWLSERGHNSLVHAIAGNQGLAEAVRALGRGLDLLLERKDGAPR